MKYRTLKTPSKKNLLNTDSQARHLDFPVFNNFSFLKAKVQRVKKFILPVGTYELIPSSSVGTIFIVVLYHQIYRLKLLLLIALVLCSVSRNVFIFAIPQRFVSDSQTSGLHLSKDDR